MQHMSSEVGSLENSSLNFPTTIVNDGSVQSLPEAEKWVCDNLSSLKKELGYTGAILFRGFPINDAESYDRFFAAFDYPNFTYKESLSNAVRINHTDAVFTANEAPKDVEIYLHNEMAQTPIYPGIISLFCQSAADQGGATVICRSDQVFEKLHAKEPELTAELEREGVKYTTHMPSEDSPESGQGRSWKGTLSVDSIEAAEEKLSSLGYSWKWHEDGSLSAQTAALPAIKSIEDGRRVFFNQIIAAYMGWSGAKENPASVLCFGDDTDIPGSFLDTMVATAEELSFNLEWQDGDVAVVDNNLAMHGRRPYSGERKRMVFVTLGR